MTTLSEAESKRRLSQFGITFLDERIATDPQGAIAAADAIGYPVVLKLSGDGIAHKTERGLVRLNLTTADAVREAATELLAMARDSDGDVEILVAPMVKGTRELIAGLVIDEQFGPCVMVGVGGIFAEAIADAQIRLAPLDRVDAEEMLEQLATQALLGEFRGEVAVDRDALCDVLLGLSALAASDNSIVSVDLNPLIVSPITGLAVAVDALVEIAP